MEKSAMMGLDPRVALERLAQDGPNELGVSQSRPLWVMIWDVVREPMFLLLIVAGILYFVMGDTHDALILLGFVGIIIFLTIFQEHRTDHALEALRDLSSPRAMVVRGGLTLRIAGHEVVRGDVLFIAEGDRIAADGELLESHELATNESLLTGESTIVDKQSPASQLFAGTLVVRGQGWMRVTRTGSHTEFGRIGRTLNSIELESSPLRDHMGRLTRRLALIGIVLSVLLVILFWSLRGDWIESILAGITLAMAILPQELPVIMIVFLALGARRLAAQKVLTRRLNAIETLGQTTVLCVDKTGTLTQNQMAVACLYAKGVELDIHQLAANESLPELFHELIEYSVLASEIDPHDPMEKAFFQIAIERLSNTDRLHPEWTLAREYELSSHFLAMTHLWRDENSPHDWVASKGAPEAIAELCQLTLVEREKIGVQAASMAAKGLRVLGVARALHARNMTWPDVQHDFNFQWVGLIGLADPLRADVPQAIALAYQAGIRVVMITGDHPTTAVAIGVQAGITGQTVLTGAEIIAMAPEALAARLKDVNIFARVKPEQKLLLVNALKAQGEIVAMTGDGVNDAPALKAAHIGIAMGQRGTDVAREAAALVLLEDSFTSIITAIHRGRRTFANLRQATLYTLAVHIPVVGMTILPVVFGFPILLAPLHIAFLELIIDPACSVVFESEESAQGLMQQNPRKANEPLVQMKLLWMSLLQGSVVTLVVTGLYFWLLSQNVSTGMSSAAAFVLLVTANAALIFPNRISDTQWQSMFKRMAPVSVWVLSITMVAVTAITTIDWASEIFGFESLSLLFWLACVTLGLLTILPCHMIKFLFR